MAASDGPTPVLIPEMSYEEEVAEERNVRRFEVADGGIAQYDLRVVEPYKKVITHGGYDAEGRAIIVFSANYLPRAGPGVDYENVMDHLFLYLLERMSKIVVKQYVIVYFHSGAASNVLPNVLWMRKCYQLIDRRYKKDIMHLYVVHPTFWVKATFNLLSPFISSKFARKLTYVDDLKALSEFVPIDQFQIPEAALAWVLSMEADPAEMARRRESFLRRLSAVEIVAPPVTAEQ